MPQIVELLEHDEKLFVFGMEGQGAYIEGFRATDGKNLFRFATSFWFADGCGPGHW
jgi:hypothetical protein